MVRRAILDGHLDLTFRGTTQSAGAGTAVNVPAGAPHQFRNSSDAPARLLCISAPPGQDEFFTAIGDRVPGRTSPPPRLDQAARAARIAKAIELARVTAANCCRPPRAPATAIPQPR